MAKSIELRPHVAGYRSTPKGDETIEFDQWILLVDGRQAGYVQKADTGRIALTQRYSEEEKQEIRRLVESEVGPRAGGINQPPDMTDDEPEDDDEDDDEIEA